MSRIVLLAREFDRRLNELTSLEQEVNGVLLYRLQGRYCPIETIYMTGLGTAGHVQASQNKLVTANEFFRRNPEYSCVKFHTHSRGTIKINEYYATHFSQADINSYDNRLKEDADFIGMVVTPTTKLLYAPDNPTLRLVEGFPSEAEIRINNELSQIALELGQDTSRFTARYSSHESTPPSRIHQLLDYLRTRLNRT